MRDNDSATLRCGSFVAIRVDDRSWRFICDWLPEFDRVVECSQHEAGICVVDLQSEFPKQALAQLADVILQPNPLERLRRIAADKTNPLARYAQQYLKEIES